MAFITEENSEKCKWKGRKLSEISHCLILPSKSHPNYHQLQRCIHPETKIPQINHLDWNSKSSKYLCPTSKY